MVASLMARVVVIPSGYAVGMLFVAAGSWGKLDIAFTQSLLLILLTFVGAAIGNLIIQQRHQEHQPI